MRCAAAPKNNPLIRSTFVGRAASPSTATTWAAATKFGNNDYRFTVAQPSSFFPAGIRHYAVKEAPKHKDEPSSHGPTVDHPHSASDDPIGEAPPSSPQIKGEKLGGDKWKFTLNPAAAYKIDAPESVAVTTKQELLQFYEVMSRIRRMETEADKLYKAKEIKGFLHLYSGQEAVVTGMEAALTYDDGVITAYRDHGHALLRGSPVKNILAELTGRATGVSKGKGGSMHMYNAENHYYGGNGIVGAQVPVGAGLGLSYKILGQKKVAVALYGDGAANQGQIFEAFNMSKLWKLPVIYVCENNKYGMGTAVHRASANVDYYTRGDYIPGLRVDGMDVLAVKKATEYAKAYALANGPIILEMETYRYSGHSMSDPGTTYRTREEVQQTRAQRDPIERVKVRLLNNKIATASELKEIDDRLKAEMEEAVKFALESPYPEPKALYVDILGEPIPVRGVELSASYTP